MDYAQVPENTDGLVIGLEGPWGSGKTSLLNLTKRYLDNQNFIVKIFNPWLTSDRMSLVTEFFRTLTDFSNGESKLTKQVTKYGIRIVQGLTSSISIGVFGINISLSVEKKKKLLRILKKQHFTTFMLPRKLTKLVYTRPALSPLDFLRIGSQRLKCLKIFHAVFASLYGFAALVDWCFGTSQNARPDTVAFSGCCERGLPNSPCVQCHFGGESGKHSATRRSSAHSSWFQWPNAACTASKDNSPCLLPVRPVGSFVPARRSSYAGHRGPRY